jgi:site-specific DNA recombinase
MTTTLARPVGQPDAAPKTLRAAIYCRISDDADGDGEGVERQRADCLRRADREGWRLAAPPFIDNDRGASRHSKKRRPAYEAMIDLAQRGGTDVILAYSNSRLTRRPAEFEELVKLAERGLQVRTIVSGDDDLATADGLMVARIKASVDAAEADKISERVRRGVADKVSRGEWLGGPRPFGWQDDATTLNEAEAEMIRSGASHVIAGGSVGQLIREWNASGVTTARGAKWRHVTVNRVLTRWRNAGIYEYRGKPQPAVEATWEPILTREQVEQVRAILNDPKRARAAGFAPVHLMSGIARCGKESCGAPLKSGAIHSRGKVYRMYRCSGQGCGLAILIDVLDDAVARHVCLAYVSGLPSTFTTAQEETSNLIAEANGELAKVLAERADVEASINAEETTIKAMRPTLARLAATETQLREDIERAHRDDAHAAMVASAAKVFTTDAKGLHRASIEEASTGMRKRWNAMPLEQRRKLVRALLDVRVMPGRGDDRIAITDKFESPQHDAVEIVDDATFPGEG